MKKWLFLIITVAIVGVFGLTQTAQAAEFRSDSTVVITSDEVIEDDLYMSGSSLRIEGEVTGDVYAAGEQVTIVGQVGGDLLATGGTVNISGPVDGSVRTAAQFLHISGSEIGGSVSFIGDSMTAESDSVISHGVNFLGNSASFNGTVGHGITATGSSITINNAVGTDSSISAERLNIQDNAVIAGDLDYRSNEKATISDNAQVNGNVTHVGEHKPFLENFDISFSGMAFRVWSFVAALIVGTILLLLARKPMSQTANVIRSRPLASLGLGFLAMLVTIPLAIFLMISFFGIPLAILLVLAVGASLYVSKFLVGIALGSIVLSRLTSNKTPRLFYSFLLGLIVLYLLNAIPIITALVSLAIGSLGLGAILLRIFTGVRSQYATASAKKK